MKNRLWWLAVALAVGAAWNATGEREAQARQRAALTREAQARQRAALTDEKIHNWPAYSGDKASTKYSPLDQINKDTVGKLSIAWRQSGVPAELKAVWPDASAPANWQNTPIMVDGLLYMSSGVGSVVALDAATGRVVWFDVPPERPQVNEFVSRL